MPSISRSPVLFRLVLLLALLLLSFVSLNFGALQLEPGAWLAPDSDQGRVLYQLRLPRLLLALFAGALLACTGAAAQSLFRNPLADPSLIGVSAGAALAVVTLMVFAGGWLVQHRFAEFAMPLTAFMGGLASTWLVMRLSRSLAGVSVTTLLLTGMAINAIALAGIGALKYLSDELTLRQASFWLMGNFSVQGWLPVIVLSCVAFPVLMLLAREGRELNLLLLGVSQAQLLGVDVIKLQRRLVVLCALGVGSVVAFGGLISFVGLIVPHLVRLLSGPDNRHLLPHSALLGAFFLGLADLLSRMLASPAELPIGILTALVGGPFFLFVLLYRMRRGGGYA
ncbi:FecCD family ABC transporter permease [Marinobacterium lutimaris]|uniref:Iron complex transport system permease protein n=1 Tax=Marinobacterium lutimaris TaxID=568106 RepID=A0A1H6D5M6_9GAMM|nr:iron ABC transporter permease [Marinobacterium lutimaris]SEG80364.1 iron complex transport system permease protein [Marinobacterium lutimaris]